MSDDEPPMGKVFAFPGLTVPDNALPAQEAEKPAFLDWAYVEIPDFQSKVTDLDDWAEQGEEVFWPKVNELVGILLSWTEADG